MKIYRKRKRTEPPPEQATPGPAAASLQPAPPGQDGGPGAAAPGQQQGLGGAKPSGDAAEQVPQAEAPPAELLQQQQDNAHQQGAALSRPMDVEEAQAAVGQPQQQQAEEEPAAVEPPPLPAPVRVQDLKAVVSSLLDVVPAGCPTAVRVAWLLREALRAAVPPGDAAAEAAEAAALQAFQQGLDQRIAAAQQLLLQGGPEHLQQFDRLPPMVRGMCASERHAASLRQQLRALEQEEAAWLALEAKYRTGADCLGGAGGESAAWEEPEGDAVAEQHVDVAMLEEAQRRAEHHLALQIAAIDNMLEKAELVVAKAQQQCSNLQAEYHKENFQSYAHVNSPQVLVKILSQAQPAAGLEFVPPSPDG